MDTFVRKAERELGRAADLTTASVLAAAIRRSSPQMELVLHEAVRARRLSQVRASVLAKAEDWRGDPAHLLVLLLHEEEVAYRRPISDEDVAALFVSEATVSMSPEAAA